MKQWIFLQTLEQCENQLWVVRLIGDEFHGWGRLLPCDFRQQEGGSFLLSCLNSLHGFSV